jgi:hypothetical protein
MSVILVTQGTEIRRIAIQSYTGQIICETLFRKKPITKKCWWSGSRCPVFKLQYQNKKRKNFQVI